MNGINSRKIISVMFLIGFSLTFLYFLEANKNFTENKDINLEKIGQLLTSPSTVLDHDENAEIHGYADQYITWSFSTYTSQIINVWALDAVQYSLWTSGFTGSGHLLSTASSDSGTFTVPQGGTWYIVYWNDVSGSQNTLVTYNANFVGDSRPPSISVNSPYSGASYRAGENCEIKWSSINAGTSVKIELYRGEVFDLSIITSTSNDGSYYWTIPADITPGSNYQIKVSSLSRSADDSSVNFEIRDPNIFTIFFPNSTSSLSVGNRYDILFDNSEYVHEINVSLYYNDEFVYFIETQRNNWGFYYEGVCSWFIPYDMTPGLNYSILICDSEDANVKGISNYFEIVEHRGLIIIDPTETTRIKPNSDYTIRWNSTGSINYIKIILWRDLHYEDGLLISTQVILTIAASTPNDGSFEWNIPDLPKGSNYYLKLVSTTDSSVTEYSDDFYIGPISNNANSIPGYNVFITNCILLSSITLIICFKRRKR